MSLFTQQLAKKGKSIDIQTRSLSTGFDSKETSAFTTVDSVTALVCTPRGKTVFDGVDTEVDVTHEFHIQYPGFEVTAEHWILLTSKGNRYRVLRARNCTESDQRVVIECTERGATDKEAASG